MSSKILPGVTAAQPRIRSRMEYKWVALSVTTIGSMMAAIDSTIVILGLPQMMVDLHADLIETIWVIMAYILVSTVFLLTFGRVADMIGRVRIYSLGSQVMQDFVVGMHIAFLVSVVMCLVAATISMVRGKEDRKATQPVQAGQKKQVK